MKNNMNVYFVRDDELIPEMETRKTVSQLGEDSIISEGQMICS